MGIGDAIACIRRLKRIGQKDLAKNLGISVSYLSLVENGRRKASYKLLRQIACGLGVSVAAILFEILKDRYAEDDPKREIFIKSKHMLEELVNIIIPVPQIPTDEETTKANQER